MSQIYPNEMLCNAASVAILEELDARGFTAEDATQTEGLAKKISDIIQQTLCCYTNYSVIPPEVEIEDDYPPYHPLENEL